MFSVYKLEKSDAALNFFFFLEKLTGNLTGKSSTRITNSCLKIKCHFTAVSTVCVVHMRMETL